MSYYLLVFLAGAAGSFHCIGMCGGFACALGGSSRNGGAGRSAGVTRHLLYNSGRAATYVFIGVLAGAAAQALGAGHASHAPSLFDGPVGTAERVLSVVAGLLMVMMALQFFGVLHRFHAVGVAGGTLVVSLRSLLSAPGPGAPLAFGVFNGFLPCPLVYAFAAQAASTANALSGALTMAAFALGTFPAMLLMGGLGRLLQPMWRRRGVWIAGGFILLFGLLTIGRGLLPMGSHGLHLTGGLQ